MAQRAKRNLLISVIGIILIILLTLKLGVPFLINLSLLLSGSQGKNEIPQNSSFIAPPILDSLPSATSSADITISGIASKKQNVNLYINSNLVNTIKTRDDGRFFFKEIIKTGENSINAKVSLNGKESDLSNTITVVLKSAPPFLNITSPSENQSFSKDQNIAEIRGSSDIDVKITINGLWAITDDSGKFVYRLPLQNGENKIKVTATDLAGNKTEKEIRVSYSP